MEQHPVPRNISGFQFHLIGDMTVRQFAYLISGGILAVIFFKLPILPLITWPLGTACGLLGVALAFVPIQERPLDRWLVAFIKSIYSPTQFIWRKNNPAPAVLLTQLAKQTVSNTMTPSHMTYYEDSRKKLDAYLKTLPKTPRQSVDSDETKRLQTTLSLFQNKPLPTYTPKAAIPSTPVSPQPPPLSSPPIPAPSVTAPPPKPPIPEKPLETVRNTPLPPPIQPSVEAAYPKSTATPIPGFPQTPNIITGIIRDKANNLLPNIIVTIKDVDGIPVRALKTNRLGQFASSTPLMKGDYRVEFEDPLKRYSFGIIDLTLTDAIIVPLEILAKSEKEVNRERLMQEIFGKTF